jgi:hypothetical protein
MTTSAERLSLLASLLDSEAKLPSTQIADVSIASHVHVWNEVPVGAIDGVNAVMTLAGSPTPTSSLLLFRNGLLLRVGLGNDYALVGSVVTFLQSNLCQPGDVVLASYTT